jgi:hypothetical protein
MMIGWAYLVFSSFCFQPEMISNKNTRSNIFTVISLCLFHKGITTKGERSSYFLEVLVLGQKSILGNLRIAPHIGEVVSPSTPILVYLSQDLCQQHNEICNIYDKQMTLQPPF